jgi:hypothetical protein
MSKKLVVSLAGYDAAVDNAVTTYLMAKPWGIWHYINNTWLIAGVPDSVTPRSLHDELEAVPGVGPVRLVIYEVQGEMPYWGRATNEAWEWMSKYWGKPSPKG